MINVSVNGYGTIGKRVADAIVQQPDMKLIGVSKTKPNHEAKTAVDKKYPLYVVKGAEESFSGVGFEVEGTIEEMIENSDIVVDAVSYTHLTLPTIYSV